MRRKKGILSLQFMLKNRIMLSSLVADTTSGKPAYSEGMWTGCINIRLRQILLGSDVPVHAKRCSGTHQQGSRGGTKMHVVVMCAKWPQHPASGGLWAQSGESQLLQLAAATCILSLRALFRKISESCVLTTGCRRTQQLVLIGSRRQRIVSDASTVLQYYHISSGINEW